MIRRISTKWVLAVLAAVVVPFLSFAWFVDQKLTQRLSWDVVHYYLLSLAADLADRVDNEVRERRLDIEQWAGDPLVGWAFGEAALAPRLGERFDRFVEKGGDFDLLLAVDADGRFLVSNEILRTGAPIPPETLLRISTWDYTAEPWFEGAASGSFAQVDHHVSPLLANGPRDGPRGPADFHVGFACPVFSDIAPGQVVGVVFGLLNWEHIQNGIVSASRPEYFQGLIGSDIYSSSYAWIWRADADTIIAHPLHELYHQRVSEPPVGLPQLVSAARSADWGMYPEYEFNGVLKNAAFKHCASPEEGGFGWVVGIGIDNDDIYGTVNELRQLLVNATLLVLAVAVAWTVFIARRTTRPILELQQHTRRIAAGDLDSTVEVRARDELGELAQAFNSMTRELRENRAQLVKAEKEAAWREMARQVAHEIKNPLTPIQLSASLLKRAKDEGSPDFDDLFARTIDLITRQVENMRRIASDFHSFAGERDAHPERFPLGELVDEVIDLNRAWAQERGVEVLVQAEPVEIYADRDEMRRVLINLVSNALEAMEDGGRLELRVERHASRITIVVRDTGPGLDPAARERLFEPYFTTRSHGTGLGLAICKRIVHEMGGEISVEPAEDEEGGTVARIDLYGAAIA